ncbi:T9SS type A sorting domain-containing protein [Flavobacterium sp.]|uniref:DUF7619 domain-containing protein n=1 Tax=Flavobacterium sp. TaxID=239 RepID=UPI0039E4B780
MKKALLLLLLITGWANAQIINIPDANFKARLLAASPSTNIASNAENPSSNINCTIDTNANGEIEVAEAALITRLYINNCNISSIEGIEYFVNLKVLHAYSNQISVFDLSNSPNLVTIYCSYNNISHPLDLSVFPNLQGAYINHNHIPSLNLSGLSNLKNLMCEVNDFTQIDLSDLTNLKYLHTNHGDLTTLDVSNCTLLETLECQTNSITSLILGNNPNLLTINAGINSLTSVDLSGCPNLNNVSLAYNQLTSVDVSANNKLTIFGVNYNPLTTVDVSNLTLLQSFGCGGPLLETVYMKNGRNETFNLTTSPNIDFICADEGQLAAVQTEVNTDGNATAVVSSYCSFFPGGDYNTITGHISFDLDNDGCDASDINADYLRVNIAGPSSEATYINGSGNYTFYTGVGNHTVTPQLEQPTYFNVSPVSATANFPLLDNSTIVRDFCLTANGYHPDMEIVLLPLLNARPGFNAHYQLVYKNKGNQIMSGQVSVAFQGDRLDFVSASVATSAQTDNLLTWNYSNLLPFEVRTIDFWLAVNDPTDAPPVNEGDILHFNAGMNFLSDDPTPNDNYFILNQVVTNALDPNDKTCLEGEFVTPEKIGEYLHYNINFENIGTTEATNVVIKDLINTDQFDLSTLQIMYASHPVRVLLTGNKVEFIFENINLPPSITNPIGGHGNVLFKIKTLPTLEEGDMVTNTAHIFFDYNHPIVTNEARTTFNTLKRSEFKTDASVVVYPNPAKGLVSVQAKSNIQNIAVFDVQGRLLQTAIENKNTTTLDLSQQSNAIYFLKITTADGIKVEQIIKE